MSYSLGIDLGTTYTAAAVRVGERVDIVQLGSRHAGRSRPRHIGTSRFVWARVDIDPNN